MSPLTEDEIRRSFVNCSKGEARRISLPRGFADLPWSDLDFLGWRDPGAPERGYIVAEHAGRLLGVVLRVPPRVARATTKTLVCSVCLTAHAGSGVSLLTARRVGEAGRRGDSVGAYICDDLACSLYLRGRKKTEASKHQRESLTLEERIARATTNLGGFLDRVLHDTAASA
ncbi:FBP domain-containing protein [Marinactinospora thermotolerans]|uniref:FBP domain-containing protein n=1 Tax=Marinactinospora thermotolerans TaxID=531310 RepID=UPI00099A245D|nr:FBP domain-containing protein [Marinactinospora thermotolerans]